MTVYQAQVFFINKDRDKCGRCTEHETVIQYMAESYFKAILSAKLFADDRLNHCWEMFSGLSCIKVGTFRPITIGSDGQYVPPAMGPFFEWKCDYAGTFEQWAKKWENSE